ncbi:MAG: pyruvate kinase, partial [Arcticibacterium sp.]
TPNLGTSGFDTFIYTICDTANTSICDTALVTITITPAPVANPDADTVTASVAKTIVVLANDVNPDNTSVIDLTKVTKPVVTSSPSKGSVTLQPDGSIVYTANLGTSGFDTFIYTICDTANTSICDTALVTITITPAPVANPDADTVTAGVAKTIVVLVNDVNPDNTSVIDLTKVTKPVVTSSPSKGSAIVQPDGSIIYTPNLGTSGFDTFIYTICDTANTSICDTALVTITITPAPVANPDSTIATIGIPRNIKVLINDLNPNNTPVIDLSKITLPVLNVPPSKGIISVEPDGSIFYTADQGSSGSDSFIYTICDKTNPSICDTALITINIAPVECKVICVPILISKQSN